MNVSKLKDEEIKPIILELINQNIKRDGINNLITFLNEQSDFFIAPASRIYHGNFDGGLARHSLQVFNILLDKIKTYHNKSDMEKISLETITIAALFHDLCKIHFYKKTENKPASDKQTSYLASLLSAHGLTINTIIDGKQLTLGYASQLIEHFKNGGKLDDKPEPKPSYEIDDKLPIGHGEKSIFILAQYIELKAEEIMAIRWHMAAFDAGIHFQYPSGLPFRKASNECPLVTLLFTADYEAANIFNT